jgi:hypothetical protein
MSEPRAEERRGNQRSPHAQHSISLAHNRRIEREKGRVPKLAAGASRSFHIEYSVYLTQPEVQAARDRIAAIQGDHKPQVDSEPEKAD